jgi:hypothetical protein
MDVAVFVVSENKHENCELKIQLYALGVTQIGCYCEFDSFSLVYGEYNE